LCGLALVRMARVPDGPDGLPPILGPQVPRTRGMRLVLTVSIVTNLGLLAAFKYTGFVAENVNALGQVLGLGDRLVPVMHVVLPVGISFYTFKAMSYVIDVYRGEARPMRRFTDYMCFEAFFPDLVAGPIIRYAAMEEQMRLRSHTVEKFARGVAFFAFGMAKKILIANPMGHVADTAFGAGALHAPDAWFGLVGYAFQIYFDFSGYSDMACGLALMLGILTGPAAFAGGSLSVGFWAGTGPGVAALLFAAVVWLMLAWKTAGWFGFDRWLLPLLGMPWRRGALFDKHAAGERGFPREERKTS